LTIELHEFQQQAATTMVDRFTQYVNDPITHGRKSEQREVPFYQALSSITASGKTVILADVVKSIGMSLPVPPIVLWLSKGKVVVEQSLANLMKGGKYHHLLGDAEVKPLAEYDADDVANVAKPLVYFATVGTFNQKDKENGTLVIYRCDIDTTDESTWDALKVRTTRDNLRRPLIVVYDEAQNLTDQQTELLLEQEPKAFLLASATMRLPDLLGRRVINPLKDEGWTDDTLVTAVDATAVAESGLVKATLALAGYQSPMEETVGQMMKDMKQATADAKGYRLEGRPKAIYVCNTNIVAGNANETDDPKQPFAQRQAPPILIWRELVEHHKVDPDDIAVYCNLKMHKDYPAPDGFHLFKGGDKDYDTFTAGDYHHVIFNLSLQEGWDDPWCYFAYIDKSMDSRAQIEQVIGRVLRQPGVRHYPAERLNTAHFYVRVDRNQVFQQLINSVEDQLRNEAPGIRVITTAPGKATPVEYKPKKPLDVPRVAIDADEAKAPIAKLIRTLTDYRTGNASNTKGKGSRSLVQRRIGDDSESDVKWETFEQSGRVLARFIFQRELRRRYVGASMVTSTSDAKFDALVGLGSSADVHITEVAKEVADTYLDNVELVQQRVNPYVVGTQLARPDEITKFKNSLHTGYAGLNTLEAPFAKVLDKQSVPWVRNPSRTGYGIPLPSYGPTHNFYPDFIVWVDAKNVIVIDTKGGHLLAEAAYRKLLYLNPPRNSPRRVFVRLVSEGTYNADTGLLSKDGYTVWGATAAKPRTVKHFDTLEELMPVALRPGR
jgi:type III restriction enzyme